MFELESSYAPAGDQPQAIAKLTEGLLAGAKHQALLGVTGSGKTFTVANVIRNLDRPTLVISHNKTLAAQLPDCLDRTAAEKLKGLLIAVPRSSLPQHTGDEYYWSDLIGLAVVNEAGVQLGTVANLLETGANQVLSVKGDSGEILIPFVVSAIRQVDVKNKTIRVDWSADYLR